MYALGNITISNNAETAEVDIEGIIGIPEQWQFDNPEERVSTYDKFKASLNELSAVKASNIVVNIRSCGGDVNDALLIYDTLVGLPATITTRCYGYVASAATLIAQAASKGRRMVSDNGLYLIHHCMTCGCGNINDMNEAIGILQKTDERIVNIYSKRSGKDNQHFYDLMGENNGNGKWLDPQETVDAGLADAIIREVSPVNFHSDVIQLLGLPDIPVDKQITNLNQNMKIPKALTAILNFFGFDKEKEHELPENGLERLNNAITEKDREIETLTGRISDIESGHTTALSAKDERIAELTNQVSTLQAENDRLKAGPTETKQREDPPHTEPPRNVRMEAYNEDVKQFKDK